MSNTVFVADSNLTPRSGDSAPLPPGRTVANSDRVPATDVQMLRSGHERIHDRLQMLFIEQQARELRSTRNMLELQRILVADTDEPLQALNRFAWRLGEMTTADRIAIYLVARRAGESVRAIVQQDRSSLAGMDPAWSQAEQSLVNRVIETELCNRCDVEPPRILMLNDPTAIAIAAPIRVKGRVLGAMCVAKRELRGPVEWNRKLIEFSVETISHSLRRVLDEATVWRQARHDHLTGLVNRRSFDACLDTALDRVQRGTMPECSLILADLDHFKSINDRFGHQVGDRVLVEVAQVLSKQMTCLRIGEHSVAARYGGEEFAILLPNIAEAGACRIGEQIRAAIAGQNLTVQNQPLQVTISLGIASCPNRSVNAKWLIAAADQALYQSKSRGRNRVSFIDSSLFESCDELAVQRSAPI